MFKETLIETASNIRNTNYPSIHPPPVTCHTPINNYTFRFLKFKFAASENKSITIHVSSITLLVMQCIK